MMKDGMGQCGSLPPRNNGGTTTPELSLDRAAPLCVCVFSCPYACVRLCTILYRPIAACRFQAYVHYLDREEERNKRKIEAAMAFTFCSVSDDPTGKGIKNVCSHACVDDQDGEILSRGVMMA